MTNRILIMIPALNEQSTIGKVVESCRMFGNVLVVDDGSSDETSEIAKVAGAVVISNIKNKGYEYSLNVGYAYALENQYDVMITMDADGELPPDKIPEFICALDNGACLAVGARKKLIRLCEKVLSFFSKYLGGVEDPYCGMKAYDLNIPQRNHFSRYNSVGTSLAFEYVELGANIVNIEIDTNERQGKSRFGGFFISEIRLSRSMFVGLGRLLKIWVNKKLRRINGAF